VKQKPFRLPDKLADEWENFAKQKGLSENQLAEEALTHFMECTRTEKVQSLKLIPLKFSGTCNKCGRTVEQGEFAWWAPGAGILCADCEVQKYGDKSTARKYIKVKELEFTEKALRKICDSLADKYRDFNIYEFLDRMHALTTEGHKLIMLYLKERGITKTETEQKTLEDMTKNAQEIYALIQEIREFMVNPFTRKKKKRLEELDQLEQE
jgi:hypothetical protein